jgi:hypothetical protein
VQPVLALEPEDLVLGGELKDVDRRGGDPRQRGDERGRGHRAGIAEPHHQLVEVIRRRVEANQQVTTPTTVRRRVANFPAGHAVERRDLGT